MLCRLCIFIYHMYGFEGKRPCLLRLVAGRSLDIPNDDADVVTASSVSVDGHLRGSSHFGDDELGGLATCASSECNNLVKTSRNVIPLASAYSALL